MAGVIVAVTLMNNSRGISSTTAKGILWSIDKPVDIKPRPTYTHSCGREYYIDDVMKLPGGLCGRCATIIPSFELDNFQLEDEVDAKLPPVPSLISRIYRRICGYKEIHTKDW